MKQVKSLLIFGFFIAGISIQSRAQVTTLPEVTVLARNYKYLKSIDYKGAAEPIKLLERQVAAYDVKSSEYYDDEYDTYAIRFHLPNGFILAVYDQDGKIIRTAERFNDVALPVAVQNAIGERYPKWAITKDVYVVKYGNEEGAKKEYKIVLENGSKRLRIKTNEKGEFID
ncbi:MAG: nicotinate-nucleotide adenylyltransferase [Flavihumibacter sp.]|nr:nicotinate-nucleotide adenylyltransferase [Flavihumibacter sp.]